MNPSSSEVGGSNPEPRRLGSIELTPVHQRSSRRLRDAVPTVFGNSVEFLRELVRSVVREELQRQRLDHRAPAVSSLADVVREEVRLAVRDPQPIREPQHYAQPDAPPQRPQRVSYADALLQGPPHYASEHAPATR
ncbi:hypothetical protein HPB52_000833 [Rhipicephalus sanguineus]|uniref:Uncharacterized protein n=1 Tax=Rhipicephalus sanguineus TaxID=34632 RepID=A0A9D4PEB2_RHISA|nr:hypothetical protein HPB52_000833 [Rhipicephalus sanguineus]